MTVPDPSDYRKSSFSDNAATCVEIRRTLDAVRDSKNLDGPTLPVADLRTFVALVKTDQIGQPD